MFKQTKQGTIDIISGDDVLDRDTIEEALTLVEKCLSNGQPKIIFNLNETPLIDSEGLGFLLETRDQCTLRGGLFKLAAPSKLCRDILKITGIQEEIEIYDDLVTASGSFVQ